MPNTTPESQLPCCPALEKDDVCDVLDFHYRLRHTTNVVAGTRPVQVEVLIHARLERCPGPLLLGDLVYSTTLLPGEKVRLFTADRRSRFSFDSSSQLSYRNEQTSEERFYMASMHDFMSDVSVRDSTSVSSQSHGSSEGHGETNSPIAALFTGPSVDVSGSYDASSTSTFLRELNQHVSSADRRAELATRTANSVSVGEVNSRTHSEGESEDHFESASRSFSNPNTCHAVTFFFYQINKSQIIRFTIESIQRRVIDPAANTKLTNNPFVSRGGVRTIPAGVLATDENRLKIEENARTSVQMEQQRNTPFAAGLVPGLSAVNLATLTAFQPIATGVGGEPLSEELQHKALAYVDERLVKEGLIDKGGKITDEIRKRFSFERRSSLPTPGLLVKGCIDECNICEPALEKKIALALKRLELENELLKRKIDLLDQSQEYRCCPATEEEMA